METNGVWLVAAFGVLIVFSAFFSGSETALISSGRIKLNLLAEKKIRGAKLALSLIKNPAYVLGTILVGNNLVNVMAAAVATVLLGPVYATLLVTILLLIFAEITPKTLAAYEPERYACRVAVLVYFFGLFFKPVVWVTTGLTDLLLWPFLGGARKRNHKLSRLELLAAIRLGGRDGELEPAETRMTREVLSLKDTPVWRLMIPFKDVNGISESASFDEIIREVLKTGNTRYPVYRNNLKEPIGLLLVKDLLVHREGAQENWRKYVRPIMRCSSILEADELLRDMQIQCTHMALVENTVGQIVGIVTMEDILEEIVGEIYDEFDDDEGDLIREVSQGRYAVQGRAEVDDLCKVINIDLGHVDNHVTLAEWYTNRTRELGVQSQRIKVGNALVIARRPGRFEIIVKEQFLKETGITKQNKIS
jgi:putative hemolysin